MKKLIIASLLMLVGIYSARAESVLFGSSDSDLNFRAGGYVGYNVAESSANYGGFVSVSGYYMMAELDLSQNKVSNPDKSFLSLSPMVGVYFGNKIRVYGLLGIANWTRYDMAQDELRADKIYARLKLGVDFRFAKNLFINLNWNYVCNEDRNRPYGYYGYDRPNQSGCKNNSIAVGVGVVF